MQIRTIRWVQGTFMLRAILVSIIGVILSAPHARADWITNIYSNDRAEVDSINRFLVIRDTEPLYFFGEKILPLGDVSGDGYVDILAWRRVGTIYDVNPSFVFYGGPLADDSFDLRLDSLYGSVNMIGDINADGYDDLGYCKGWSGFRAIYGGPNLSDSTDFLIPSIKPWAMSNANRAIDLLGDGTLYLPLASDVNGGPVNIYRIDHLRDTIPEFILPDTGHSFGFQVVTGEFSGDGYPDIAVSSSWSDTNFIKFYFGGPSFDTVSDFTITNTDPRFGQIIVPLGDFNADGHPDLLAVGQSSPYPQGIYFLGDVIDNQMDMVINIEWYGGYRGSTDADLIGDFNSDGYPDFVTSYTLTPSAYHNVLHVYLGGPRSDSVISPDIIMDGVSIPGGQVFLGWEVRGIGDFSGDGIDDFAAMSTTASGGPDWYGEINFFAGYNPDNPTDVDYEFEPGLPKDFQLDQSFPNPFNSETTIGFRLPQADHVTLVITNALGRRVRTLIDRRLSPGKYQVQWDGKDELGTQVASGVYIYSISTGEHRQSRKMMLLK